MSLWQTPLPQWFLEADVPHSVPAPLLFPSVFFPGGSHTCLWLELRPVSRNPLNWPFQPGSLPHAQVHFSFDNFTIPSDSSMGFLRSCLILPSQSCSLPKSTPIQEGACTFWKLACSAWPHSSSHSQSAMSVCLHGTTLTPSTMQFT